MGEIDPELLIRAVKMRPALYNKNDSNYYSHKKHKAKLWSDVCKEVFSNWDQLRPQDKVEYGHELQKRWKSLRTCFTRELVTQKKEKLKREKNEGPVKRRKVYEYFEMMSFLLNPDDMDVTELARVSDDDSYDADPLENSIKTEAVFGEQPRNSRNDTSIVIEAENQQFQPTYYERSGGIEEKILDMLREIKRDEEDEDKQFMLSLVPSFRKLSDKQKFEARIEMLKVLRNISFQDE